MSRVKKALMAVVIIICIGGSAMISVTIYRSYLYENKTVDCKKIGIGITEDYCYEIHIFDSNEGGQLKCYRIKNIENRMFGQNILAQIKHDDRWTKTPYDEYTMERINCRCTENYEIVINNGTYFFNPRGPFSKYMSLGIYDSKNLRLYYIDYLYMCLDL